MSQNSRVALLGICGGIAAYKAVEVASRLRKAGWSVQVAMTEAARKFVTPLTFAGVTGQPVLDQLFPDPSGQSGDALYPHLYPATRADLFILLPATANMIAQLAHGLARDMVSTAALSLPARCRRYFCPAMNVEMWNQPVVQSNVAAIEKAGWVRIGPNAGPLACGMEGPGRMAEPTEILAAVSGAVSESRQLSGKRILVLSGPTREHLDPVRYIGNPSTGRMGLALAEEAAAQDADVEFVTGPVAENLLPRAPGVRIHPVISADDMLNAARPLYASADIILYAAAVADYAPSEMSDKKLPKRSGDLVVTLKATPDIAATLNESKRKGQVSIGFALQTHDGLAKAKAKLKAKRLDGIVLNDLDALGGDSGTYTFIAHAGTRPPRVESWGTLDKRECARRILDEATRALNG